MGRPGAGKGTQAQLLAEKVGAGMYSTGERCRAFAAEGTYFGGLVKKVIDAGDLMPEWFSIYLFEDKMIRLEPGDAVVFEGAGRKLLEAQRFHDTLSWIKRPYTVVYLDAKEEVLRERLLKRAREQGRADDAAKAIELRFKRFKEFTEPSIEFFRSQDVVIDINADQPVERVYQEILSKLGLS